MKIFCPECGTEAELTPQRWRCECGGAWEPVQDARFAPEWIQANEYSIWRYLRLYGLDFERPLFTMGAGWTPLLPLELDGRETYFKLEYFSPTASFKDRGAEVMVNILAQQGVSAVAEDSSGNAGAAVAACAARAGMRAEIYVPGHASPAKQAQIRVYGAQIVSVAGPRANARLAAIQAIQRGVIYASHTFHPGFITGQASVAYEVWEQLGRRAPDWYVAPVGQGVHLLAAWLGFCRLKAAGLIERVPRMVGAQAALLAPLCHAFDAGLETVPEIEPLGVSLAEGVAINPPERGRRLLQALRESGGACVTVAEEEIRRAYRRMAGLGFYIEPTSAVAVAALRRVQELSRPGEVVVVPLTGSGLKGAPDTRGDSPGSSLNPINI